MSVGLIFFLLIAVFLAGSLLTLKVVSKPKQKSINKVNIVGDINSGENPDSDI